MANNINWGKIYESTWFGSGVVNNTINWGKVYADLTGVVPAIVNDFSARVEADGGVVESTECLTTDLTFLTDNPIPSAFTGLLDTYSGAAAAYSLRQLSSTYSGDAIRVRRSSDNAEQNIGFVNNELDTASLETFCSGTDGFVAIWYDQSGSANNAANTTAVSQPKIVSSGSTILENGKPAIEGDGNSQLKFSTINTTAINSFVSVTYNDTINKMLYGLHNDTNNFFWVYSSASVRIRESGVQTTLSLATSGQSNTSIFRNNTNFLSVSSNGSLSSANSTDTLASINTIMNGYNGTPFALVGTFQEFIVWPNSDESTNRSGIETNINDHYSIY